MGLSRENPRRRIVLPAFIALASFALYGQQPSGEIRLSVEDSSGAAIQASGKLDDQAFETDAEGQYDFQNLAAGRHRLEVSKPGFATKVIAVTVGACGPVNEAVKLELAS